jgi:hypothetical protein
VHYYNFNLPRDSFNLSKFESVFINILNIYLNCYIMLMSCDVDVDSEVAVNCTNSNILKLLASMNI